jgi:hypothetical protein
MDSDGKVVRRITGPAAAGMQRVNWDLRYPAATMGATPAQPFVDPDQPPEPPSGHLVMPGKFTVSLAKRVNGVTTQFDGPVSFSVVVEGAETMAAGDRASLGEFQQKLARLQRAVIAALDTANNLKTRVGLIRRAVEEATDTDNRLGAEARAIEKRADEIIEALRGGRQEGDTPPPSINQRVNGIANRQRMAAARPTATQVEQYDIAAEEFKPVLAKLRALVEGDLVKLEKAAEAAGAPWTPGRLPEWNDK